MIEPKKKTQSRRSREVTRRSFPLHDLCRCAAGLDEAGHGVHFGCGVVEEFFQAGAEVAQVGVAGGRFGGAVFGAFAVADEEKSALGRLAAARPDFTSGFHCPTSSAFCGLNEYARNSVPTSHLTSHVESARKGSSCGSKPLSCVPRQLSQPHC